MKPKLLVLAALAVCAFAQGAVGQFLTPGQIYAKSDLVFSLAGALLVFLWYRLDAAERSYRRSPWLDVGVVGLGLVALPYYFFRTRGARGGFLALFVFAGCIFVWGVIAMAGEYSTYYGLQAD